MSAPGHRRASKTRPPRARSRWRTAATSDPLDLYERSVQDPPSECDFVEQVWGEFHSARRRSRPARRCMVIREDFCGTAAVAIEWVRRGRGRRAFGVDLDQAVLARARMLAARRLSPAMRRRLTLLNADVRGAAAPRADAILALNFSYFVFKTRAALRRYLRGVHQSLKPGGLIILDAYGGSDSFTETREEQDFDGFTYVWDQHSYNPVTHEVINHIHFRFPDGSELRRAFTYDWRLWTLPELRELLAEAGFRSVTVYWEGTDEDTGEGNGEFSPSTRGEACPGWVAYLVAAR
jgi:SAM-dependent methyltransferase